MPVLVRRHHLRARIIYLAGTYYFLQLVQIHHKDDNHSVINSNKLDIGNFLADSIAGEDSLPVRQGIVRPNMMHFAHS